MFAGAEALVDGVVFAVYGEEGYACTFHGGGDDFACCDHHFFIG